MAPLFRANELFLNGNLEVRDDLVARRDEVDQIRSVVVVGDAVILGRKKHTASRFNIILTHGVL